MKKSFFAVTAKCGHVGRQFYYEGTFYIKAFTMCEAAAITRSKPRVKHDHKDAILRVEEISAEAYEAGEEAFKSEVYFQCGSRWQQNLACDNIALKLRPETDLTHEHRQKVHSEKEEPEARVKKPYKREKFILREVDLEVFAA
jgi:hypothetical protein